LLISIGETISRQTEGRPSGVFDPNLGDSIIVVYDDSISVLHGTYKFDPNRLKKDLLCNDSYQKTETGKYDEHYQYTFTNEDYEEALLLIGK
jgi:hypothetical protein